MNNEASRFSKHFALAGAVTIIGLSFDFSRAAETAGPPPMPPMAAAPAGHYQLDKSHASLELRVNHLGFSTYTTRFSRFDSELTFDPKNIPASTLMTTVDASSFEMPEAPQKCLDIMKGAQFLDVTKFPKIVFRSQKVRMTGPKSLEISGTLELHGVTRPLVLSGTFNGGYAGMANMDPQARVGFSAHASFKRSDFGMSFGVPAPGTTMGVGDLIDVSIEAEFSGPPLAAAAH
jgi:polyisoprenoid-binding protein YceI